MMRKIVILVVIGLTFLSFEKTLAQDALQYMEKISNEFKRISEENWDYTRTAAHSKKLKKIENRRKDLLIANKSAIARIKSMKPFQDDPSYRDSVLKFLEMSYDVMNDDYSKIVDLEEVAEESYDAMEAYMKAQEIANDKLDAAWDMVVEAQKSFAERYNINLISVKDETSLKLEKAGEVYKYYKQLYLAFFKPFKQEIYLMDALSKTDINAIKQNQDALAKLARESKEKIKSTGAFKGNMMLKAACDDALDFYIYEAETKGSQIVDFYIKKEKLDQMKAIMDKKGKNASKEEIDDFNNAVKDFNKSINTINTISNELNNRRNIMLNKWNNATSKLFERNIAKK